MNDLLGTVKASFARRRALMGESPDMEVGLVPTLQSDQDQSVMQQFLASADVINGELAKIKELQGVMVQLHERCKTYVKSRDVEHAREEMEAQCNEVAAIAKRITSKLQALQKENEATKTMFGHDEHATTVRARGTIIQGLCKKLKDQMGEFLALRDRMHEEYREVVQRRMYTITGQQLSDEEADKLMEGGQAERIFRQQSLANQVARNRVMNTLAEVEERNKEWKQLEVALTQLRDIQLAMAAMVEVQGEKLDHIDKHVDLTGVRVKAGVEHLEVAKTYKKKSNKFLCWVALIATIIILIVTLAVVLSIKPWAKN